MLQLNYLSRVRRPLALSPFALATLLILLGFVTGTAQAGFTLQLSSPSVTIVPGQSVTETVQLVNNSSQAVDLYGFTATLYLTNAPAGLQVTSASMPLSNYVFQGNSFDFIANPLDGGGNPLSSFPSVGVSFSDVPNNSPYYVSVEANTTYSLGEFTITASSLSQSGSAGIVFDTTTSEFDGATSTYTFTPENGTINVAPAPSTMVLGATGFLLLVIQLRRVRRLAG